MTFRETIEYLRLIHGSYNFIVMLTFFYQASLGLRIRSNRKRKTTDLKAIKRHRKIGPILAAFGIIGFILGISIIYLDYGHILKYPLHFFIGLTIVFTIISVYLISKKIKGPESRWRAPHLFFGILTICLYPVQFFIGLGILF